MVKRRILVLADDLTGALEVGGKLRSCGVNVLVRTYPNLEYSCADRDVTAFVIDAETRHLNEAAAAKRTLELALFARNQCFHYIYKKTDSTLRGNIAAELGALATTFPTCSIVYVPAYPKMGRTVKNGVL